MRNLENNQEKNLEKNKEKNLEKESFTSKYEEISRIESINIDESDIVEMKEIESCPKLYDQIFISKGTQIDHFVRNIDIQTDDPIEIDQRLSELEEMHNSEIQNIENKITDTINKKNLYIKNLESLLQQSIIKNKELEALLKQLKC